MEDNITKIVAATIVEMLASPNNVLKDIAMIFKDYEIEYAVIGGLALIPFNYNRATDDIDILISKTSFEKFKNELVGTHFQSIAGTTKNVYYSTAIRKYKVELLVEGDNNTIVMPNPKSIRVRINNIWYVTLKNLIILKLVANRTKDKSDVGNLIMENDLPIDFMNGTSYSEMYSIVWKEVVL